MAIGAKYNGSLEWVAEVTPGTVPTNPAMQYIGRTLSFAPNDEAKYETIRYLPDASVTDNKALLVKHIKTSESLGFEAEFVPLVGSSYSLLDYFIGKSGAVLVSDTQPSLSMGFINALTATNKYHIYKGCYGESFSMDIPENGKITNKIKMIAWDLAISTTYIGTGSHAALSTAAELTFDDISNVQMGDTGGALANITDNVNSLNWSITNNLGVSIDINQTTPTKIKNVVVNSRDIKIGLNVDYSDLATDAATNLSITGVRAGKAKDIAFTLDGKTYKFIGAKFPKLPYSFGADDLVGDSVESLSCTGMTVT